MKFSTTRGPLSSDVKESSQRNQKHGKGGIHGAKLWGRRILNSSDRLRNHPAIQYLLSKGFFAMRRKASSASRMPSLREDMEFLSPAAEVLKTPASPIRVGLAAAICILVVAALVGSWFGKVDIYSVAPGRIQPAGRSKLVQPLQTGTVRAIYAQEGSFVRSGTLLLELDATEAQADNDSALARVASLSAEITRRQAALAAVRAGKISKAPLIKYSADIDPVFRDRESSLVQADFLKLNSDAAYDDAKVAESEAQQQALQRTILAETAVVSTLEERMKMRSDLQKQGWESLTNVIDATEAVQREYATRSSDQGQLLNAIAVANSWRREKDQTISNFVSLYAQGLEKAQNDRDAGLQDIVKTGSKVRYTKLTAPIDGTVQQLTVSSLGQVVLPGQQLMTIVPGNGKLEIEALVQNQDIGFVQAGDSVVIKIDSFPYTKYGTVSGHVSRVSRDSLQNQQAQLEADTQQKPPSAPEADATPFPAVQQLVFPVIVTLDRDTMEIDGKTTKLTPGMSVTLDIRTGNRRILEYLLSPLIAAQSEAIHER